MQPQARDFASRLREEHRRGDRFRPLRADGRLLTPAEAYAVQDEHVARLCSELGSDVAGFKIGLTSRAMQEMCGIAHPVYGRILRERVLANPARVALGAYGRLGVEFEIAVRLGRDWVVGPQAPTLHDAAACADAVAVALELVDDRHADYATLDAPSLIADNAWNAGVVLGPWLPVPADVGGRAGRLFVDDMQAEEGRVGNGTDHPFVSVAWLAQALVERQLTLRAGQIVMTGSVLRTRFAAPQQVLRFAVDGLGEVVVTTAAQPQP